MEVRIEQGLATLREQLLTLREMRLLEERLAVVIHEPRWFESLSPEAMLRLRAPLLLTVERLDLSAPSKLRWPLQLDLYRFEVLGKLIFDLLDRAKEQEARLEACIGVAKKKELVPDHSPRKRDVDKHGGALALRRRRSSY